MSVDLARRSWLIHGRSQKKPVRPPWSLPEALFTDHCSRCGACVNECPEQLIYSGDGGFPELKFDQSGCDFCGACARSCPTQAISPDLVTKPWEHHFTIHNHCLTMQQVFCNSCLDDCSEQAIVFDLTSAVARPHIDPIRCSGCGLCVSACPVSAIGIQT
ncbi:ferredoxin-type protein NapF [Gynuella sp.]|uniref:ferredoxin-type protein NapF n=1 Tax=Gynuella sp. TaxID=2969146 RepID=UPI003D0A1B72